MRQKLTRGDRHGAESRENFARDDISLIWSRECPLIKAPSDTMPKHMSHLFLLFFAAIVLEIVWHINHIFFQLPIPYAFTRKKVCFSRGLSENTLMSADGNVSLKSPPLEDKPKRIWREEGVIIISYQSAEVTRARQVSHWTQGAATGKTSAPPSLSPSASPESVLSYSRPSVCEAIARAPQF